MRRLGMIIAPIAVLTGLAAAVRFGVSAKADLEASEAALNPSGEAYEINPDDQGLLWISDFGAGEVWAVDPAGSYEVYAVLGSPSDARSVGGWLWWADGITNTLGRASTTDGAYTLWRVPGSRGFYGTTVDAEERLWATDAYSAYVYRLDPDQGELCTFTLPAGAMSYYVIRDADALWLGDWVNERLLRLEGNSLNWWSLPASSSPCGMAVDERGYLWFADQGRAMLARLDPVRGQLTNYALPEGDLPGMVAVSGGRIWYTEQYLANLGLLRMHPGGLSEKAARVAVPYPTAVGRLDPQIASHTIYTPTVGSVGVVSSCTSISPSISGYVTILAGELRWSSAVYPALLDENGWSIYQLPQGSLPWGIAVTGEDVWVVDSDRQVLARYAAEGGGRAVYLPLIVR